MLSTALNTSLNLGTSRNVLNFSPIPFQSLLALISSLSLVYSLPKGVFLILTSSALGANSCSVTAAPDLSPKVNFNPHDKTGFEITKPLLELLGYPSISIGVNKINIVKGDNPDKLYLINANKHEVEPKSDMFLNKNLTFYSKERYDIMAKKYNVDTTVDNYFKITTIPGVCGVELTLSTKEEVENYIVRDIYDDVEEVKELIKDSEVSNF